MAPRVPVATLVAAVLAVAVAVAGCGGGKPPPATPLALSDLVSELVTHRVAVVKSISGDPGCDSADLAGNGVHLQVRESGDSSIYDVYLLRFKDQATWQREADAVAACAAAGSGTAAAAADGTLQTIAVSPFRAYGAGWPPALEQALDAVIHIAAAGGTNPGAGQPEE